jgi:hypothetical protein
MNTIRPRQYPQANGNYTAQNGETDKDGRNQNAQDQRQNQQNRQIVARGRAEDIQPQEQAIRPAVYSPAANAYANGYIPCLMVMSAQIDDDIAARYRQAKWLLLQGYINTSVYTSTYDFYKNIIGFDLASFMMENQTFFQTEINKIIDQLMRAE